jgi:hypothetical protein
MYLLSRYCSKAEPADDAETGAAIAVIGVKDTSRSATANASEIIFFIFLRVLSFFVKYTAF